MDNLNVLAKGEENQLNEEKPPPRVCPRCKSENTKFCYFNNYSVSQPRYFCKNCRRYWTHGGALRNIPIGGSCRQPKRPKVDQSSVSQMVSVEIQQVNHQSFRHVQENNEFVGSFGGSSASIVGNHFGSLQEIHCVTNMPPVRSFRPMDRLDVPGESFQQEFYDVGANDLIGNPLISQSIGGYVNDHNGYRIDQVDQRKWHQGFNNIMNMNHKASTSGNRGSTSAEMNKNNNKIKNNCLFRSS